IPKLVLFCRQHSDDDAIAGGKARGGLSTGAGGSGFAAQVSVDSFRSCASWAPERSGLSDRRNFFSTSMRCLRWFFVLIARVLLQRCRRSESCGRSEPLAREYGAKDN